MVILVISIYLFSIYIFDYMVKDYTCKWQPKWYNRMFGLIYGPFALLYWLYNGLTGLWDHHSHPFWWEPDHGFCNLLRKLSLMKEVK